MANLIYASPDYAMGDSETLDDKKLAEAKLKQMRGSLKKWLGYRKSLDRYAAGQKQAPKLFRSSKPMPPALVAQSLRQDRLAGEQKLADSLYGLLTECGAQGLVYPNVAVDPDAAVKLASRVITSKTPSEAASPEAQGIVWFVLAIPVAGIVLVLSQWIKSQADIQMEKEKQACIMAGACTDEGFWLKIASVAVVSWLAWDKFGLREAVKKKR